MGDWLDFRLLFSGAFALVGVTFLAIGIFMLREHKRKLQRCTSRTWGKVIGLIERRDKDGVRFLHPVFEYTVGDRTLIKESGYGSTGQQFQEGQNVVIYFNPNDYDDYYAEGETVSNTLGVVFTAVGSGTLVIAAVAALLFR